MLLTTAAVSACPIGKYDTYKGSTLNISRSVGLSIRKGNMILIKDRHRCSLQTFHHFVGLGNMILIKDRHMTVIAVIPNTVSLGNMILIKDRHKPHTGHLTHFPWGNMILIKDRHFICSRIQRFKSGKYDTYKGLVQVSRIYDFLWNYGKSYGIASS